MPRDIVIVVPEVPDVALLEKIVESADGQLHVRATRNGALSVITDQDGDMLLAITANSPILVRVKDEPNRLIPGIGNGPFWWLEGWVPFGAGGDAGLRLAEQFAAACGGRCHIAKAPDDE